MMLSIALNFKITLELYHYAFILPQRIHTHCSVIKNVLYGVDEVWYFLDMQYFISLQLDCSCIYIYLSCVYRVCESYNTTKSENEKAGKKISLMFNVYKSC